MDDAAAVFEPLCPRSTYDETVGRIGTAIRLGLLAAGTRLPPERVLAERLRISRSTLRQALSTLTARGHLVATRGRTGGTFVAPDPPLASGTRPSRTLEEAVCWRMALEVAAAHLAAERAASGGLDRLEAALAAVKAVPEDDWPCYRRADVMFHLAVAQAAGSATLGAQLIAAHADLLDLFDASGPPPFDRAGAGEQHGRLVAAIARGDAAEAAAVMREHVLADSWAL